MEGSPAVSPAAGPADTISEAIPAGESPVAPDSDAVPLLEPHDPPVPADPAWVETPPVTTEAPPDEPVTVAGAPRDWTRLVHGRIAYLRCEGIPAGEGTPASDAASGCPRDRELEAQVWRVVDGLVECPSAPTMPGEVDLVIDLAVGAPPEIRTRDRFAPDVVRLDAPAVLSCVAEPLGTAASTLGASRLVVSFRFRAQP